MIILQKTALKLDEKIRMFGIQLSVEFIFETIGDKENLSTCYWKLSAQ